MGSLKKYYFGKLKKAPLKFTIDTTLGTGTSMSIPPLGGSGVFSVRWGDGSISSHSSTAAHVYSSSGIYQVEITGNFSGFGFNNTGDKLKIKSVEQWGGLTYQANQTGAFYGCTNLASVASDISWLESVTNGTNMFRGTKITSLNYALTLNNLVTGTSMFMDSLINTLPSTLRLNSLTNGTNMFTNSKISSLPSGMALNSLTNGTQMFTGSLLASLPSTLELSSLTNGTNMFTSLSISSLPSIMLLNNLTDGTGMFYLTSLNSLPASMTLNSLVQGFNMFRQTALTVLPTGMTLPNLQLAILMFLNVPITTLPTGMTLPALSNGAQMFQGVTINKARYSQLLIDMNASNPNNGVAFHGGNSKYNTSGQTARNALTSRSPAWVITDGGFEA